MPKTIIKLENISKSFGKNNVLKGIDLNIREGEIYGIIGMSGSGKSTILSVMADLIRPDNGTIKYNLGNQDNFFQLSEQPDKIKKLFGYSFQIPSFHDMLTVEENIQHFSTLYGLPKKFGKMNADLLLKMVELSDAKNVLGKDLSGGMQKRLCFACALVHSPKILFLDEPTANLDPVLRKSTWEVLKKINAKGTTIVIASQLLTELDSFCNRICIIHKGKIIKEGPVEKIKKDYSPDLEIHLRSEPGNYKKIITEIKKSKLAVDKLVNEMDQLVIYSKEGEVTLHKLIHILENIKENPIYVDLEKPPLSEIFASIIQK